MDRRPDPRIEVEPLSDARWARTERALFERVEREVDFADASPARIPRWRSPAALIVAGAFAASIGALASRALWRSPDPPMASHIETGDARSHLVVGGATIDVAPRSDVLVSGDGDHGVLLVLDKGAVDCEVAPRRGRPPFVVQAGDVRVRVVGTHFAVARDADGVNVDVTRGIVEVDALGKTQSVAAGAHWPSAPAAPSQAIAPPEAPSALVPSASSPSEPPALARAPSSRRALAAPATSALPEAAPDATATAAPRTAPAAPRAPTAQQRYEAAARLESSDPAAALASYRAISRDGSDAWAANALYAAGRLEADRGARDDARALLEEYVARFPRGLNAPDARELLERVRHPTP